MNKRYQCKCTGKPTTFKDLKDTKPSLPAATSQVSPPAANDSASDDEFLTQAFSGMKSQGPEFGFRHCVAGFSTERIVNEDTIPNYDELKETEDIADKFCIICQKSVMNLSKLSDHLDNYVQQPRS